MVPVGQSGFLLLQRRRIKGRSEEVEREEPHRWAASVASVPSVPSALPHAAHTEISAPPASWYIHKHTDKHDKSSRKQRACKYIKCVLLWIHLHINLTVQGQSGWFLPLVAEEGCAHPSLTGSPFLKSQAPQQAVRDPEEKHQFIRLDMKRPLEVILLKLLFLPASVQRDGASGILGDRRKSAAEGRRPKPLSLITL